MERSSFFVQEPFVQLCQQVDNNCTSLTSKKLCDGKPPGTLLSR